jgi:hypothetical protein
MEKTGSLAAYLRSLPPGTRSKAEIDRQVDEERDSWDRGGSEAEGRSEPERERDRGDRLSGSPIGGPAITRERRAVDQETDEPRPRTLSERLRRACQHRPGDYRPWGDVERGGRGGWHPDCSSGCRHYLALEDVGDERLSADWGVCINPKSHRYGLLTFEHQGCPAFEAEETTAADEEDAVASNDPTGWKALDELMGCIKDGPRYWGEVMGDVEALVSPYGTVVLCKEYRSRGRSVEQPWIEMTLDELKGVLSRGDELVRAVEAAQRKSEDDSDRD